jgi:hypothetical protein
MNQGSGLKSIDRPANQIEKDIGENLNNILFKQKSSKFGKATEPEQEKEEES